MTWTCTTLTERPRGRTQSARSARAHAELTSAGCLLSGQAAHRTIDLLVRPIHLCGGMGWVGLEADCLADVCAVRPRGTSARVSLCWIPAARSPGRNSPASILPR